MSGTVAITLLVLLAVEAVVLLLGGLLDGHWKGLVYLAIFGAAWLGDQAFGRWASRNADVAALRGRWALVGLAVLFAFYAGAQVSAWAGVGEAW